MMELWSTFKIRRSDVLDVLASIKVDNFPTPNEIYNRLLWESGQWLEGTWWRYFKLHWPKIKCQITRGNQKC